MTNTIFLSNGKELRMEDMVKIKKAIKLLSHSKTNRIIELLRRKDKGMKVTDIFIELRMEQSEVSQCLANMRAVGWVEYKMRGKFHYYSIVQEALLDIMLLVEKVHNNLYPEWKEASRKDLAFELYRALGHGIRMEIMRYIMERGSVTVQPIYTDMELEQSIVSQHLRVLRECGVVRGEKDGKFVEYFVNDKVLEMVERLSFDWLELYRGEEKVAAIAA